MNSIEAGIDRQTIDPDVTGLMKVLIRIRRNGSFSL
jgi:hypothetical protein